MIKEFVIFRNTKQSDNPKAPTHRVMATINNTLTEIGAGWSREGKNGNKYLSCKLRDIYKDHTDDSKSRNGYNISIDRAKNTPLEAPEDDLSVF